MKQPATPAPSRRHGRASPQGRRDILRVLRELDSILKRRGSERDLMEEKLRKCPQAFQAGLAVEQMFAQGMVGGREAIAGERLLPPPGAVLPVLL